MQKWEKREKKWRKKRHGMRVKGASVKLLAGLTTCKSEKPKRRKRRR